MRILSVAISSSLIAFGACSSNNKSDPPEAPDVPQDDVALIDGMVAHHQRAIAMANEEIARGGSQDVKDMASQMIAKQQQESDMLLQIRKEVAGSSAIARVADPHSDLDMSDLQSLSGTDLDVAFLANMIPHHASAIVMAHRALPNLDRADLVDFAHSTIDDQTKEMGNMLEMEHRLEATR